MSDVDFRQLSESYARLGAAATRLDAAEDALRTSKNEVRDAINAARQIPGSDDTFIEGIIGRPLSDVGA